MPVAEHFPAVLFEWLAGRRDWFGWLFMVKAQENNLIRVD
jgi:hypothetical protein